MAGNYQNADFYTVTPLGGVITTPVLCLTLFSAAVPGPSVALINAVFLGFGRGRQLMRRSPYFSIVDVAGTPTVFFNLPTLNFDNNLN